jgi:hypothetical protein
MKNTTIAVPTLQSLRAQREEILQLADRYGAYNLRVFGSIAREQATAESDIDLLVSFQPWVSLLDVVALMQDLSDLLGFSVDIVDDRAIKPRLEASILKDAVPL